MVCVQVQLLPCEAPAPAPPGGAVGTGLGACGFRGGRCRGLRPHGELLAPGFWTVSPAAAPRPGPLLWVQPAARGTALGPGLGWRCSWSQTRREFLTLKSSPAALVSLILFSCQIVLLIILKASFLLYSP